MDDLNIFNETLPFTRQVRDYSDDSEPVFQSRRPKMMRRLQPEMNARDSVPTDAVLQRTAAKHPRITPGEPKEPSYGLFKAVTAMRAHLNS